MKKEHPKDSKEPKKEGFFQKAKDHILEQVALMLAKRYLHRGLPRCGTLKTLRHHWSKAAVLVDRSGPHLITEKVPEAELLQGELTASISKLGCYLVRRAVRICSYPDGEPADDQTMSEFKGGANGLPFCGRYKPCVEISAKHRDHPNAEFRVVCRATQSLLWTENIGVICAAKENLSTPTDCASLFVQTTWVGDSHGAVTWHRLSPDGQLSVLYMNDMDQGKDDRRNRFIPMQ